MNIIRFFVFTGSKMKPKFLIISVVLSGFLCACNDYTIKQACEEHNYEKAYEIAEEITVNSIRSSVLKSPSSEELHGEGIAPISPDANQMGVYFYLFKEISESEFQYHLQKGDTCYSRVVFSKPQGKTCIENLKKKYKDDKEALSLIRSIERQY